MFKRGWGGPGRGLTTSLHLKCYISCPTWPDILWILKPDIMCSCQYCLVRCRAYAYICTCIMCIDYPNIVVLYKSEDTFCMSSGESPRNAQSPLSGEWRKTTTHHALSPHPDVIISTSFITIIDTLILFDDLEWLSGFIYCIEKWFCRITIYKIVCYTCKLSYYLKS